MAQTCAWMVAMSWASIEHDTTTSVQRLTAGAVEGDEDRGRRHPAHWITARLKDEYSIDSELEIVPPRADMAHAPLLSLCFSIGPSFQLLALSCANTPRVLRPPKT